jgi:glyoxylase I family protein
MISGAHHLAIKVRDLGAAERFYVGVLGLSVARRWPSTATIAGSNGERALWLPLDPSDPGGTFLALEVTGAGVADAADHDAGSPRAERPGHHLVAFRIHRSQRDACEARLAAAGVAITHRTDYTIYFSDPEGNRLGLSHYPDPA